MTKLKRWMQSCRKRREQARIDLELRGIMVATFEADIARLNEHLVRFGAYLDAVSATWDSGNTK